jgi:mannan polymerase II complex ANP1 subunit
MEQERIRRETEDKEWAERLKKIKEQYQDTSDQWEKDKADIHQLAMKEKGETVSPVDGAPKGAESVREKVGGEKKE